MFRKCYDKNNSVTFHINGKKHTVGSMYDVGTSLNDYIRDVACLKGTKVMCREGRCGCCAVTVTQKDHTTGEDSSFSINSCLCPLYSVDGWQITTVEGIGSRKDGYHPIQNRIAKMNGSQCGYCTPGMCMNMYGLLHQNATPTQQDIEDQFDGNICRCTGYRPILDSMKTFAKDSTLPGSKTIDKTDLKKNLRPSSETESGDDLRLYVGNQSWYRPEKLNKLIYTVLGNDARKVRFVYGNTASSIYKEDPFDLYIDLHKIEELYKIEVSWKSMKFGSNMTFTNLINALEKKKSEKGYGYFEVIIDHFRKIGNVLLRNQSTWAGNLMMKYYHHEFASDVFTVLEAAGAHITLLDCSEDTYKSYPLLSLLTEVNMKNKLIVSLELFAQDETFRFQSYKIMPRSQNTAGYVNVAFRFSIDARTFRVVNKPSLVVGGINKYMIHALKTEKVLEDKILTDKDVLKRTLDSLTAELDPAPGLGSPEYRRSLVVNLLYKFILEICGAKDDARKSGQLPIERPVSKGVREFQQKKSEFPLKEPMPKLASYVQASGEAEYINDMPSTKHELCGAFVITSKGPGTLEKVDPSAALKMPGVVDFVEAKDIRGTNNIMPYILHTKFPAEELFCSGKVLYAGQRVGLILAESQTIADEAAEKVVLTYSGLRKPIVTIDDAVAAASYLVNPWEEHTRGEAEVALKASQRKLSGVCSAGTNYHFYLENQVTLCVPTENGLDVYAATQCSDETQGSVALLTGLPMNNIKVTVPRVGGSFGGKILSGLGVSGAVAVASHKHNRPVRVSVKLSSNMKMAGKRLANMAKYEVGFNEDGTVNVVSIDVFFDGGYTASSLLTVEDCAFMMDQGYNIPNWRIKLNACKTDKPPNTSMRAPGGFPASFIIESVMEHAASYLDKNPVEFKQMHLYKKGMTDLLGNVLTYCTMEKVWTDLRQWAEVDKRQNEINNFNKANRWKKRALTMTPVKYGLQYRLGGVAVDVSIYNRDGTVTVCQGGVEIGQGLFTKVAQAVAKSLGIPISSVKVLANNTHSAPNTFLTGTSLTSEYAVLSALKCCDILNERIAPMRKKHPDYDWKKLVDACDLAGIELTAKNKTPPKKKEGTGLFNYFTYIAGATEVELDVLTGEYQIRRVDIVYDCGESLNPDIDIGQIEGSLVMGIGNLLLEDVIYDTKTGAVINDGAWGYKLPTTKDIPVDIRIKLLPDAPNPAGIKGSKATGEPPILLAPGAFFALKQAMEIARAELNGERNFQSPVAPLTPERLLLGCDVPKDKLLL